MKKFLQAAFKITVFQILFIASVILIKYVLTAYKLIDKIQKPFIWICFGAGVLFVLALSINGVVENRCESFEQWRTKRRKSTMEKILSSFSTWGFTVPIALAYVLLLYVIIPTSLVMFIALFAGIVIRNSIDYFSNKHTSPTE